MIDTHLVAARRTGKHLEPVVLIVNGDDSARAWIEAIVFSAGLRAVCASAASELASCLEPDAPSFVSLLEPSNLFS